MKAELSIVVVNWNGGDLLCRAVESVLACPPSLEYEVVVIDNASTDPSIAQLRASKAADALNADGRLRIIENAENLGFGRANNQAFALTESPFLLLLNPDTEVTPGAIDSLVNTIHRSSRVGVVGPKLLNEDGSLQISVWRNPPAAWEILLSQMKLYLLLPRAVRGELLLGGHWDHNRSRSVPMLSGAALLVKRAVIDEVGGFDEQFHMYGEDNEWCLRISRGGWQLIFQPAAIIHHHGARSSLQRWTNLEKLRVQLEASYAFQRRALPRWRLANNQLANLITSSAQYFARRLRGIEAPEIKLARQIHWQHLKQALGASRTTEA